MRKMMFAVSAALVASMPITAADATQLLFTVSADGGSLVRNFTIDSDPVPAVTSSNGFIVSDVDVNLTSPITHTYHTYVQFFLGQNDGGMSSANFYFSGPQLFSGLFNAPHFAVGNFDILDEHGSAATLAITDASAAVPEPAAWAMMLSGFGLIGTALRSKRSWISFA